MTTNTVTKTMTTIVSFYSKPKTISLLVWEAITNGESGKKKKTNEQLRKVNGSRKIAWKNSMRRKNAEINKSGKRNEHYTKCVSVNLKKKRNKKGKKKNANKPNRKLKRNAGRRRLRKLQSPKRTKNTRKKARRKSLIRLNSIRRLQLKV